MKRERVRHERNKQQQQKIELPGQELVLLLRLFVIFFLLFFAICKFDKRATYVNWRTKFVCTQTS